MRSTGFRTGFAVVFGSFLLATASTAAADVTCKDGTVSSGGPRACRQHGGIVNPHAAHSKAATAGEKKAAEKGPSAAAATNPTTPPADAPPRGSGEPSNPANATAQCRDGTFTHEQERTAACGHNGGVAKWLDRQAPTDAGR